MKSIIFIVSFLLFTNAWAIQAPKNFDPKMNRFMTVKSMTDAKGKKIDYGIEYPADFDSTKKYPILWCLPGGDFSLRLASYYNYVYTPSTTFKDYIKIYAINNDETKVLSLNKERWIDYIEAIKQNENGTDNGWVISGASNGGTANFKIITASPETFRGFIVIPGNIGSHKLLPEWENYDALIVYGSEDSGWVKPSIDTFEKIKDHVRAADLIKLEGEEHVLPLTYNINPIYEAFENLHP